jgi:UrcA family protein
MRNRGSQLALLFVAAGVSGAAGATVAASPQVVQKSVVVRYSDDDAASDNGATHLYAMLDGAAHYVCEDSGQTNMDLVRRSEIDRCEQTAIANAVSLVSSASLTSVYNRHYRDQPLVEKERLSDHTRSLFVTVVG